MNSSFAWRKRWLREYESPWSVIGKFKFANALTSRDVLKILGTDHVKRLKAGFGRCHRELITLAGLNPDLSENVLGINLLSANGDSWNKILGNLTSRHELSSFIREDLALCHECIQSGYHSIFHQWKLLHYCPFHMIPLSFGCPSCNQRLLYEITDHGYLFPYVCNCGHSFLQASTARYFYKEWGREEPIRCKKVTNWLSLVEENVQKLKDIQLFTEKDLDKTPSLFDGLFRLLDMEDVDLTEEYMSVSSTPKISRIRGEREKEENFKFSKEGYPGISEYSLEKLRYRELQTDLFESYSKLLSSVARKLRKTVLSQHKTCIERYYNDDSTGPRCPFAFAYIHWRTFVQDFYSPLHVTAKHKYPKTGDPRFGDFPFALHSDFFKKVFRMWEREVEDISLESRAALKWVLGRSIAHVAVSHFWTWLEIAQKEMKSRMTLWLPPFSYEYLPSFFLVLPKEEDKPFEIHWEKSSKKETIIRAQTCPYQTVKSRRDPHRKEKIAHAKQYTHFYEQLEKLK